MASKTTDNRPDHVVFDELWCAVRRDRRTGELAGHAAFLEFAQERGWNWAIDLETARLLSSQGNKDDALALLTRCESQVPSEHMGYAHLFRGLILADKEDFDGAIDATRKALAQPGYLNPGRAWSNLGIFLRKKDDFDGAIDACHKALAQPDYDQPGYAWNNMGIALARQRDPNGAIEAFRKALAQPEYDTPDYAWGNLGNAFFLKGDCEAAIDAYRKALAEPKYDSAARAWVGLGWAYEETGNVEQARAALENALAAPDKGGKFHAEARESLDDLKPARQAEPPASKRWLSSGEARRTHIMANLSRARTLLLPLLFDFPLRGSAAGLMSCVATMLRRRREVRCLRLPPANDFLEVQFYHLSSVFADLLAKVYTYLKQHDPNAGEARN